MIERRRSGAAQDSIYGDATVMRIIENTLWALCLVLNLPEYCTEQDFAGSIKSCCDLDRAYTEGEITATPMYTSWNTCSWRKFISYIQLYYTKYRVYYRTQAKKIVMILTFARFSDKGRHGLHYEKS